MLTGMKKTRTVRMIACRIDSIGWDENDVQDDLLTLS